MNLIVTGSLAFDHIMVFPDQFKNHILPDKIHILNVSFNVNSLQKEFGGTAGNIAYTLKLLEQNPIIVGTVGKDFVTYQKRLESLNLTTEHVQILEDEFTAQCFITTDQDDNQITVFHGGAMFQAHKKKLESFYVDSRDLVVISPNGTEAMVEHANFCRENEVKYIFDPSQSVLALTGEDLMQCIGGAEFLIVNDYEWQIIQNKTELNLENIFQYANNLIITLGAEGSIIQNKNEKMQIGVANPDQIVDPTGCGDAYRAGFMFALRLGHDLKKCAQIAATASSYAIEQYGTQNHKFTPEDFAKRYELNFKESLK